MLGLKLGQRLSNSLTRVYTKDTLNQMLILIIHFSLQTSLFGFTCALLSLPDS